MSSLQQQILIAKGRINDNSKRLKDLEAKGDARIILIKQVLDEYADLDELELTAARMAMVELIELQEEYITIKRETTRLQKEIS